MALLESPAEAQETNTQPVSLTRVRMRVAHPSLRVPNTPATIRMVPGSSSPANNTVVGLTIDPNHRGSSQYLSQYSDDNNNRTRNLTTTYTGAGITAPVVPERSPERVRADLRGPRYRHPTVMDTASSGQFSSALSSDTDPDVHDVEATDRSRGLDPEQEPDRRQGDIRTSWLASDSEPNSGSDWEDDEDLFEEFGGRGVGGGQGAAPQPLPYEREGVFSGTAVTGGYDGVSANQPWITGEDDVGAIGRGTERYTDGAARERGRTRTARRMRREAERHQGVGSPMAFI